MSIYELTETRTSTPDIAHQACDADKLAALIESMETDGWLGIPVLVDGEQALTGSHRITAAARAYVAIPRVEVRDLAAEHGLDWDAMLVEHGNWYEAGIALGQLLPADVVVDIGLDLH